MNDVFLLHWPPDITFTRAFEKFVTRLCELVGNGDWIIWWLWVWTEWSVNRWVATALQFTVVFGRYNIKVPISQLSLTSVMFKCFFVTLKCNCVNNKETCSLYFHFAECLHLFLPNWADLAAKGIPPLRWANILIGHCRSLSLYHTHSLLCRVYTTADLRKVTSAILFIFWCFAI